MTNSTNGTLVLSPPDFSEDVAAIVYPPPHLTAIGFATNGFQLRLDSEAGGQYLIQESTELSAWTPITTVTNVSGTTSLNVPDSATNTELFFKARKAN